MLVLLSQSGMLGKNDKMIVVMAVSFLDMREEGIQIIQITKRTVKWLFVILVRVTSG